MAAPSYCRVAQFGRRQQSQELNSVGSNPITATKLRPRSFQLAEGIGLNPIQCGFESHRGYHYVLETEAKEYSHGF